MINPRTPPHPRSFPAIALIFILILTSPLFAESTPTTKSPATIPVTHLSSPGNKNLPDPTFSLTRAEYEDRVSAIWYSQIISVYLTLRFEHNIGAVEPIHSFPAPRAIAGVDDDWYYEMCAVRAFEKHGIGLTADQLGEQWLENSCGSWGSSEAALRALRRGVKGSQSGHPRNNHVWWTIGPAFTCELYGALAPGLPNEAGRMARELGHINGYAEAVDGAVIIAGAVSIGFVERDPRIVLRRAIQLVDPSSPYRQCVESVINMAEAGRNFEEIIQTIQDRGRIEYPQSNNAVVNGGITAAVLWFGEGDFWKTINLGARADDFTDADCTSSSAIAILAAMRGMAFLPPALVAQLGDRIVGAQLGKVKLTPAVDERLSDLARRTTAIGIKIILAQEGKLEGERLSLTPQTPKPQPAERFVLNDLMAYFAPEWTLMRAGFGGIHGTTGFMSDNSLETFPRDESRGLLLRRNMKLSATPKLSFEVAAAPRRVFELRVYVGNQQLHREVIKGFTDKREYRKFEFDLAPYAGQEVTLRIYQAVLLLGDECPGSAFWRNINVQ